MLPTQRSNATLQPRLFTSILVNRLPLTQELERQQQELKVLQEAWARQTGASQTFSGPQMWKRMVKLDDGLQCLDKYAREILGKRVTSMHQGRLPPILKVPLLTVLPLSCSERQMFAY